MKFIEDDGDFPVVELTRRNLVTLLNKLDDPASVRTLQDPDRRIHVRAVPDDEHYAAENRAPGPVQMHGVHEDDLKAALAWLDEVVPRDPLFTQLITEGPHGDETFARRLDGDDLAALCHAVHTIWKYHNFDRARVHDWWVL